MIALSLIVTIFIFSRSRAKENVLLDPLTLFFAGLIYYGYFIPITMSLFGDYFVPFLSGGIIISDYDLTLTSLILPLGYLGFVLGYRVFTPRSFVDDLARQARNCDIGTHDNIGVTLSVMIAALLLVCVVFFLSDLTMVMSGYEQKIQARYEGSAFSLVYSLILSFSVILLAWKVFHSESYIKIGVASAVTLFIWSIMTYSKEPMVYGGLILFITSARAFPQAQVKTLVLALAGGGVLLTFFVPSFSIYRATGEFSFVDPRDLSLPFLFSDASGPFAALILAVRSEAAVSLGRLWESFFLWIPRSIWADRPLDAAEDFARAVMPDWRPGYGLGFSPFAEAKLRFGTLLAPVLLLLSGASLSGLQRWALRFVSPALAPALLLVVQGYIMFTFHRGPFSGIFTAMLQFWIPFLAATSALNFVLRAASDR